MRRRVGRFTIPGFFITIRIGSFSICIQKILDLGQRFFIIRRTFINRKKRLCTCTCTKRSSASGSTFYAPSKLLEGLQLPAISSKHIVFSCFDLISKGSSSMSYDPFS